MILYWITEEFNKDNKLFQTKDEKLNILKYNPWFTGFIKTEVVEYDNEDSLGIGECFKSGCVKLNIE